jgi:two-component system, NtrC family, response regulator PilR
MEPTSPLSSVRAFPAVLPSQGVACARPPFPGLVYAPGSPLEATLRLAEAAGRRDCPVFLRGESGSGKEVLARFLHGRSSRVRGPFVAVNCAALPHGLIESELFGHRKGSFTGAVADNPGRFRQADGGTLFLDEIGDMPSEVQTRLLRALQEKTVSPVGDSREYPVDFRLICATHRDLRREVRQGRFREDLFYRINVVEIRLPPLRERPGDVPLLLRHFLSSMLPREEAEAASESFPRALLSLPFPGNVRELRNLAERFCVLRDMGGGWIDAAPETQTEIEPEMVPETLPRGGMESPIPGADGIRERIRNSRLSDREILHALDVCGHHRARASGFLGITRRALQYRLAKMGRIITRTIAP